MIPFSQRVLMTCFIFGLFVGSCFAAEFEWNANTEADMKKYNVYVCTVKGCTATANSSLLIGSVPHVKPNGPATYTFPAPANIEGAAVVTAEDEAGNNSLPSNMINFSTVPDLPPSAPIGLHLK